MCARVWIEWGDDTERGVIDAAKEQVRARFEQHCAAMADGCPVQASLEFSTGDWEILLSGVNRRRPDGVVIVDSEHKDVAALLDQAEAINDIEEVAQRKMFPGIFSLNSGRQYLPTDAWSFVRFSQSANGEGLTYDDHELSDFVSRLFDVLRARLDSNELRRSGAA